MRKSISQISATATFLALASSLFAGGFWLVLGNPEANPEASAQHAVLTFKMAGCHEPEKATISASAVGFRNGVRQSVPLKILPLKEAGSYAVTQQWPAQGDWVLEIVARDRERVTSALVRAGSTGIDRLHAKLAMSEPSSEQLNAMLAGPESSKLTKQ